MNGIGAVAMRYAAMAAVLVLLAAPAIMAQDGEGGGPGAGGGPGGMGPGGGFGPMTSAQRQEATMQAMKESLKPADAEWKVIQPLLSAVAQLRSSAGRPPVGMMGPMGQGGPGGQPGQGVPGAPQGAPAGGNAAGVAAPNAAGAPVGGPGGGPEGGQPGVGGPDAGGMPPEFAGAGAPGDAMGGPGRMGDAPSSQTLALAQAVNTDGVAGDAILAKLAAYRAAQKKNQEALQAAREKLRAVLTTRQEAVLVLAGWLD